MRYEKRDDEIVFGFTPIEAEGILDRDDEPGLRPLLAHVRDLTENIGEVDVMEWAREAATA